MNKSNEQEARLLALNEFSIVRAKAINVYADLERSLAMLFETLLGTNSRKSFAVFASILTIQSHLNLTRTLLKLEHGDSYDIFFDSLCEKLSGVSNVRNRIVHWIVLQSTTGGRPFKPNKDIFLNEHPNIYAEGKFYKHEIVDFSKQADFYRLLVFYFDLYLKHPDSLASGNPGRRPWSDIFSEKVTYPLALDHPLAPIPKKSKGRS